jgi:hypothetical protein
VSWPSHALSRSSLAALPASIVGGARHARAVAYTIPYGALATATSPLEYSRTAHETMIRNSNVPRGPPCFARAPGSSDASPIFARPLHAFVWVPSNIPENAAQNAAIATSVRFVEIALAMRVRAILPAGLAATAAFVLSASCGSSSDSGGIFGPSSSSGSGSGGASGSGSGSSSSGSTSSSSGSSTSSSGAGTSSGSSGASSGGGSGSTSGGSSGSASGGDGGGAAGGDASIPPGIPTAGTCSTIPVIKGDPIIAKLLAIADQTKCTGANIVSTHSYNQEGGNSGQANICKLNGAVYYQSGMNIDCDGLADSCMPQHCPSDDPTNQPQTSFMDAAGKYLSAGLTPYVVVPNDFMYPGLDTNAGGNVIAVIYNNQLEFTVFGDTGPPTIIGEASYATANNLGINPDPASGGTSGPVTYIVFVGTGVAPMDLSNLQQTWQLGMSLAQQLIASNP